VAKRTLTFINPFGDYKSPSEPSGVVAVMLSIWFRRRDQLATVQGARDDLEQFVHSLRDMSDEEVGRVVAFAAMARVALRKSGVLPDELLQIRPDKKQASAQHAVAQVVRRYQAERRFAEATGALVWLLSLRALSTTEVRHLGREMWRQLQRGQLQALTVLQDMRVPSPSNVTLECWRIPDDLYPSTVPPV
jgi:hypothetical protein